MKIKNHEVSLSPLAVYCAVASLAAVSTPALAAEGWDSETSKDASFIGDGDTSNVKQGLGKVYDIVKYIAIIIGLVLCVGGLLSVSKAAKTEGQKSQMPGWITFGIGGLMTVVGTMMFIVGNSARDLATSSGG